MNILDRKYLPDIVFAIKESPKSFNDLTRELRTSPNTIGRRLRELRGLGLVEPVIQEVKDRTRLKYQLTRKGIELLPKIGEFLALGEVIEKKIGPPKSRP